MNISREKLAGSLRSVYPFKDLDEDQIESFLEKTEVVFFPAEKMIFREGASASHLYIIFQGEVEILVEKNRSLKRINWLNEEIAFGEDALDKGGLRRSSARALKDVILIKIDRSAISKMRDFNLLFDNGCTLLSKTYTFLVKNINSRASNESLFYISKQHPIFFVIKTFFSLIVAFGLGIVLAILINSGVISSTGLLLCAALIAFLEIIYIGWQYLEWTNEQTLFTEKRIITKKRVIFTSENKQEAHISAIESLQVRRSLLGRSLNLGDIEIKTFTGSTKIQNISFVDVVQHLLSYLIERNRINSESEEFRKIKLELIKRLNRQESKSNESTPINGQEKYKKEDRTVYRKHWTILFSNTFFPIFIFISVSLLFLYLSINQNSIMENTFFPLSMLVICIAMGMWFLYQFLDWRNDVFFITGDQLVDIDSKPFGLEEKRTALLSNIQSIRYKRSGVFGLLFNYGTVFIRVGDEELSFNDVHRPAEVQERIFAAKERCVIDEKERIREDQRKRTADWIDTYHQVISDSAEDNGVDEEQLD